MSNYATVPEAQSLIEAFIKDKDWVINNDIESYYVKDGEGLFGYDIKDNQAMFFTWGLPEDHAWIKYINENGYGLDIM